MYSRIFKICLETYELDPGKFSLAPGLASQTAFKKSKVKLYLLTDIRGIIYHSINIYAKANKKSLKTMIKIWKSHIFNIGM